jgi:hypothetical protein
MLMKGNPIFKASYALFVVLATTRSKRKLTARAREALGFLERLDAVAVDGTRSPSTFRPALRLAQGLRAALAGDETAAAQLEEAQRLARDKDQGLLRAICYERLAELHGERGDYARCIERIRDAAQAFRRFGATAKADALVREFPAVDWA